MDFTTIVGLIDEHLARLIEARRLLVELYPPVAQLERRTVSPRRPTKPKSKVIEKPPGSLNEASDTKRALRKTFRSVSQKPKSKGNLVSPTQISRDSLDSVSVSHNNRAKPRNPAIRTIGKETALEAIPVVRARVSQRFKTKSVPLNPSAKTGALALGGNIPTGPIVISAEQIRSELAMRQHVAKVGQDSVPSSTTIPLTVERLAQRWMQGSRRSV